MADGRHLTLRDVPGVLVGHATDGEGLTGCTVVLCADGATGGVDVRGTAPGTRETDLLRPDALVERVHAVCLAGGSAFGLAAADGVMRYLAERGIGYETGMRPVPIVPAAILFDLGVGSPDARPGPDDGYAAATAAEAGEGPVEGRVGAGTGATVGKLAGMDRSSPGGIGSAGVRLANGWAVAALVVNNAVGNVVGRDGRILAGVRGDEGGFVEASSLMGTAPLPPVGSDTVLAVVATDARLDRAECHRLAQLAHDGIAAAISPPHTLLDGDVAFALATGRGTAPAGLPERLALGAAVVEVVRAAVERSVSFG
ncbi:MAG TPA: P1 family peptidase [candidate division Zixibacteria bacterium]|nr:P1 family peptidase [candidate division Zixibacteria bacterium]